MKPDVVLQELETLAEKLNVKVSYEALSASVGLGGLCRVKDQHRIIIDKRAATDERIGTLAEALAQLDTSGIEEIPPPVRALLRQHAVSRAS